MSVNIPDETLAPGVVIDGKYRIIGRLGEGGMGIVYHAEHVLMKKHVAFKRLHPHLSAIDQVVQRFEREAQASARIEHPNVCVVTDCGSDELGGFFIVMELLKGTSLQDELELKGPLPFDRIISIAIQICSALECAHSLGIVHRDLKPDNIMLVEREGKEAQVKIMDFGIAKMVTDETPGQGLTQAGMIFGTPHYLSPEQASGDPVDHRGDLYSLGVILFELATGQRPYDAPTAAALLRKHVTEDPLPLAEVASHRVYPPGYQQIVSRLMAKNAEDRYPSAKVCADHLEELRRLPLPDDDDALATAMMKQSSVPAQTAAPMDAPDSMPDLDTESISIPSVTSMEASAEQNLSRLWQGGGWARWAILGGAVASAVAIVIIVLAITLLRNNDVVEDPGASESGEEALLLLEQQRTELAENPSVKEALTLSVEGRTQEAIEIFVELADDPEIGASPHLHYHLAVMYSNEGDLPLALDAVERCMEGEPGYCSEPILVEILVQALREKETSKKATRVMTSNPSKTLAQRLALIGREDSSSRTRKKAMKVLKDGNMMHLLEDWNRTAVQLLDPSTTIPCSKREQLLEDLTKSGDSRVLPTLSLLQDSKGFSDDKGNCWSSLQDEWQTAVDTLQDRKPPETAQ